MRWTNFHSHTHFCDGSDAPEAYALAAIQNNMAVYGFSGHAPVNFHAEWCIKEEQIQNYFEEIERLHIKYAHQITIYKGLEIDFFPDSLGRAKLLAQKYKLDYFVGSVHYVDAFADGTRWDIISKSQDFNQGLAEIFKGDRKKFVQRYFELITLMATHEQPDIIGHIDLIQNLNQKNELYDETAQWYTDATQKALDAIKEAGSIVEVSTRGLYKKRTLGLYPAYSLLQRIAEMNIPVTINSDSHQPSEVSSEFPFAASVLQKAGIKYVKVKTPVGWNDFEFSKEGIFI